MSVNLVSFNQHERGGHFAVRYIQLDLHSRLLTSHRLWRDRRSCWLMLRSMSRLSGTALTNKERFQNSVTASGQIIGVASR